MDFKPSLLWVLWLLLCLWLLYWVYKVAQHVDAWPF